MSVVAPDALAAELNLLLADAVWALERDGDTGPAGELATALAWCRDDPSVALAAADAVRTALFSQWELDGLRRELVRSARPAWRREPHRTELVEQLRWRARVERADASPLVAAELLEAAIELMEGAVGLTDVSSLLWELVEVLHEYEDDDPGALRELMVWGAGAARRLVENCRRAGLLRPWAAAQQELAGWVMELDGPAAGVVETGLGVRLWEEVSETAGLSTVYELDSAWERHIWTLKAIGDADRAARCVESQTAAVRRVVPLAEESKDVAAVVRLARKLAQHGLHGESAQVWGRAVDLGEHAAVEGDPAAQRRLSDLMYQHSEELHAVGRRDDALRRWHQIVEIHRTLGDAADGCRQVALLADRLDESTVARGFSGVGIVELIRSCRWEPLVALPILVEEWQAQARRLRVAGDGSASDAAEEAVAAARELVGWEDGHLPALSWALSCATEMHLHFWRPEADERSREAAELAERLVPDDDGVELANAWHNRALALLRTHDHAAAREFTTRAVEQYQQLIAAADKAVRASMANALCTHATVLAELDEHDAASAALFDAAELYSRLADHDWDTYGSEVLYVRNKRATIALDRGDHDYARRTAGAVLTLCERLEPGRDRDEQQALALHTLVQVLSQTGANREALANSTALLEVRDRLAARDPVAETVELAVALGNHANCLHDFAEPRAALAPASHSVELFRQLSATDPEPFRARLADALDRYALLLNSVGQHDQAVAASSEALTICDELDPIDADTVASCLHNRPTILAGAQADTDRIIAASARAVAAGTKLADRDPQYARRLGKSLLNHANWLNDDDDQTEALDHATRAVVIFEELTAVSPDAHGPDLARALHNQSVSLARLERVADAVAAQRRALRVAQDCAERDRQPALELVARTTSGLAVRLANAEDWADSVATSAETVRLWRELAGRDADLHGPGLAEVRAEQVTIHHHHAGWHWEAGRLDQAVAVLEPVVDVARELVRDDRASHRMLLAEVLRDLHWLTSETGRKDISHTAGAEALALLEEHAAADGDDHRWDLADYRDSVADVLADLGRIDEALSLNAQALAVWEDLAAEAGEPTAELAWSLSHRARWLPNTPHAKALSERALEIYDAVDPDSEDHRAAQSAHTRFE